MIHLASHELRATRRNTRCSHSDILVGPGRRRSDSPLTGGSAGMGAEDPSDRKTPLYPSRVTPLRRPSGKSKGQQAPNGRATWSQLFKSKPRWPCRRHHTQWLGGLLRYAWLHFRRSCRLCEPRRALCSVNPSANRHRWLKRGAPSASHGNEPLRFTCHCPNNPPTMSDFRVISPRKDRGSPKCGSFCLRKSLPMVMSQKQTGFFETKQLGHG